jgi:hypothetical protein
MSTATMFERTGFAPPVAGYGSPYTAPVATPTSFPTGTNWLVVPRCTFKFEKCTGGYKVFCVCEDKMATSMVQNLCTMLAGGLCSFCCYWNGQTVCYCNFNVGVCKTEFTDTGCCWTYTSGDAQCAKMIQSCCECCYQCWENGCTCCFYMNGTPVCCGCMCETTPKGKMK